MTCGASPGDGPGGRMVETDMALHLIKLCVGCDSITDLEEWIEENRALHRRLGRDYEQTHTTRMVPKRDHARARQRCQIHDRVGVLLGGVRQGVQGAHAVHRHPEGVAEGRRGHQPDPQPGVRAGARADHHVGHGVEFGARLTQDAVDGGHQQLAVAAGVDLRRLGEHGGSVVHGDGDGRGGGVKGEQ